MAHFSTHLRDFHLTLDLDTPSHAVTPHLTLPGDFPMSRYIHMMVPKLCLCPVFVIVCVFLPFVIFFKVKKVVFKMHFKLF